KSAAHHALPLHPLQSRNRPFVQSLPALRRARHRLSARVRRQAHRRQVRSEEHTSELQSLAYLVCRLLLEKKKTHIQYSIQCKKYSQTNNFHHLKSHTTKIQTSATYIIPTHNSLKSSVTGSMHIIEDDVVR